MIGLNILVISGILLGYLATSVSPESFVYLAYFGVGYGVFLILNLFFIFFWLFVKKRFALLSLLALIIGFSHFSAYFQLIPKSDQDVSEYTAVKVISQNVRLFGWYNWRTNIADRDWMMRNLELAEGDIYCFQEFFHNSRPGTFETRELLKKTLGTTFLHDYYPVSLYGDQHYGIATFSKYPIVSTGEIDFQNERSNVCIYSDIHVGHDTIRVYNAHLASIRFSEEDYKFLDELQNTEENSSKPDLAEGMGIINRMSKAYVKRANQIGIIKNHMASSPYPIIFCGDFNDTPVSYAYAEVNRDLDDAFKNGGWGIGNTYKGAFPSFRIDYVFHSPELESTHFIKLDEEISDHHAIGATVYWKGDS